MTQPKQIKKHSVHFMAMRSDWRTPKALFQELDAEFHFDFDPCPPVPTCNGLQVPWGLSNFVNPPYGRVIGDWLQKAHKEKENGSLSVFLIPSRTDTRWWHDWVMTADEIRFIKGRLRFDEHKNCAPFPSALVIIKP